ncbi:phospho-sugar mutase [Calycomorphotria hydatis]|uniref:Phosphoglucomutase n=1 Tax=Calycomorphotria hydatis TaxID=2528027 RepID=A0A517T3Y1_9PLAN|nr:phospho-sugar mutase [Calycomorphotria hydatis]QDT63088.1 Phosphoglucomutase [Calycomorphotria hydatis]
MSAAEIQKIQSAVSEGQLTSSAGENIRKWLTEPQYTPYVEKLTALIEAEDFPQLDLLFYEVIPFGTGGRRGKMADLGSATINERTIAESAYGLAGYCLSQNPGKECSAVVTCDTRNNSLHFAKLTATTCAAMGLKVYFFPSHRSTPELSFAVRHLGCDVGAMVSASHNPPADNGFKAYWSSGGQVLAPHDKGIIDEVYAAAEIPTIDFDTAVEEGKIVLVGEDVDNAYVDELAKLSLSDARDVSILFSPLHGVGETNVYAALEKVGFENVEIFEPQREPSGDFPNVPDHFPNPERVIVFEPAAKYAKTTGADLIMASDPDADRLAIAVKNEAGEFVHFTGNKTGALIADYILRKRSAAGTLTPEHYVVETMVTTPLISSIAKKHGVGVFDELLVGFKYIGQTMDQQGPEKFIFGAEESLGYLAGEYARDKDAAVAGLYVAELAAELKAEGKTLLDRLDELFVEYGYHNEGQRSEVCPGPSGKQQIAGLMEAFRTSPPAELAGINMASIRDYGNHEVRSIPENTVLEPLPEPEGNLLFLVSEPGEIECRIAVRPSGTEPKIKFYFFTRAAVPSADTLNEVRTATDTRMTEMQDALSAWVAATIEKMNG